MKNIVCIILMVSVVLPFYGQNLPLGNQIIENVNKRDEGAQLQQNFKIELIDKRGKSQMRETIIYRKDYNDQRKTKIIFTAPSNIKGTGFLTFDYTTSQKDDDQWLYLPALRRTKRISAANRGDYFLGTDLTYEDIKKGTKISTEDYNFKTIGEETIDNHKCYIVEAMPKDSKIGKELGYNKVHFFIDSKIWISRKSEYWDIAGNHLKTLKTSKIEKIDNIWSVLKIEAINHKSEHKSTLTNSGVNYKVNLNDDIFTETSLVREN